MANGDLILTKDEAEKAEQVLSVAVQGEYVILFLGGLRMTLTRSAAVQLATSLLKAEEASRDLRTLQTAIVPAAGS